MAPARRPDTVVDLVRTRAPQVLGYPDSDAAGAERSFRDLGVDSLGAVGLRNQLGAVTGPSLPATRVSDHRTPPALGEFVLAGSSPTSRKCPARRPRSGPYWPQYHSASCVRSVFWSHFSSSPDGAVGPTTKKTSPSLDDSGRPDAGRAQRPVRRPVTAMCVKCDGADHERPHRERS
ncbi:acyl carrier protein [Streptomyces sp. NPDC088725]|uniref:acyl carrier protein n=1 Tax=Streptomyces sp. NPDC088725 TaxID=3365873 RepID=UPI00381C9BF6